jgi:hypothetical protein
MVVHLLVSQLEEEGHMFQFSAGLDLSPRLHNTLQCSWLGVVGVLESLVLVESMLFLDQVGRCVSVVLGQLRQTGVEEVVEV